MDILFVMCIFYIKIRMSAIKNYVKYVKKTGMLADTGQAEKKGCPAVWRCILFKSM